MSQLPPVHPAPTTFGAARPDRGALILTLGILGIIINCGIVGLVLGIIAWKMGNDDLREMDAGRMNPDGRGLTQAGKICGIISTVLGAIGLVAIVIWVLFAGVMVAGAAAAGAAGGSPPFLF